MSLLTGKRIHRYIWEELPIGDDVIDRVHDLATDEKQPELVDGIPLFEWSNGKIIEDDNDDYDGSEIIENNEYIEQLDEFRVNDLTNPTTNDEVIAESELVVEEDQTSEHSDSDELPPDENNVNMNEDMFENDEEDITNEANNTDGDTADNDLDELLKEAERQLQDELNKIQRIDNKRHQEGVKVKDEDSDRSITQSNENKKLSAALNEVTEADLESSPDRSGSHESDEEELTEVSSTGRPMRQARKHGIDRLLMDTKGKDCLSTKYCTYLQYQKLKRSRRSVLVTLLAKRVSANGNKMFFQKAVNTVFVSA